MIQKAQVQSLGREDPLEKEMATHSLPGESHGQRSLVGYSLWGNKRARHDLATKQQQIGYVNYLVIVHLFSNTFCMVN